MRKEEAIKIIKGTFEYKFDEEKFQIFISNLLKKYSPVNKIREGQYIREAFRPYILKYKIVGFFEDSEENKIDVLQVLLKKETSLERARTAQRNFVADYLKKNAQGERDAALVAFISPLEEDWRFSLVRLENTLSEENGRLKAKEEITPAKRWSFLVGKNEGSHTAQTRFVKLLEDDNEPNLKELEEVFSIEKVTNEFFGKYKELFIKFKESLDKILDKNKDIKEDFVKKEIDTVDFAKKTLGQIVFLYFLQKKGWFGVASDKKWGEGPKNFIRELFKRREKYGSNFFNDVLEPLFYEALAQDRGSESIYPRLNNCRMPFLNGGLFEPMNGYSWETTNINIDDSLFSNQIKTKEGDIGDGILDIFDRYNFTVNENEPLEKEVAVDPEMLGKIFENLLSIRDRKSKGAFYTPREIVHYMCQESLINYLETETDGGITREDLELFIHKGDRIIENDKLVQERGKETDTYSFLLPIKVREEAKKLDELLANIKVCDPAVGSGAFPLGMINEIVRARQVLSIHIGDNKDQYELKLHTISNSIYGVDIDPGAVEIAKLRLWLSLVVEEVEPHPLPNLEHKIMQGNSLLEEYEGIKLFDGSLLERVDRTEQEKKEAEAKISELQQKYFELHNQNKLTEVQKGSIEKQISSVRSSIRKLNKTENGLASTLFDAPNRQKLVQEKTKLLQSKIKTFITESHRSNKDKLKEEIDELKWELIEETLKESDNTKKLAEVKELRKRNIKPFFIWKLEFSGVFKEKGGFDIIIGNPPYIQLQNKEKIPIETQKAYEKAGFQTFVKMGDIYCLFYEKGNELLKVNGHLTYITSNKWMKTGYGGKLRDYLIKNVNSKLLIDLGPNVFDTAEVDTNILLFKKEQNKDDCLGCDIVVNLQKLNISFYQYLKNNIIPVSFSSSEIWAIISKEKQNIKDLINKIGTPLKDWDVSIKYGIKTGYNKAFMIDSEKRDALNSKKSKDANVIKPVLGGKDLIRYAHKDINSWLIFVPWHFPLHKDKNVSGASVLAEEKFKKLYPKIYNHLCQYKNKLTERNKAETGKRYEWYALQRCAASYYDDFDKNKVVWLNLNRKWKYSYVEPGVFVEASLNFIASNEYAKFLTAVLSSKVHLFYFKIVGRMHDKGGFMCKIDTISSFPVPSPTIQQKKDFEAVIDKILDIIKRNDYNPEHPPKEQGELERKIDSMVYRLYDLKPKEIKVVERSVNNHN